LPYAPPQAAVLPHDRKRFGGKIAAVKRVAQRGHPASEVVERLGVGIHRLYAWTKR
jgi:transposase